MVNFSQRIKDLESKLNSFSSRLKVIAEASLKLEQQSRSEIIQKERELEEWREKLEISQQERNQIKKDIRAKVLELEQSNLSNSEKQTKINKLLTEHSEGLEEVDNLLYEERGQYRELRNKVINELVKPCPICPVKDKEVRWLNKNNQELKITNWTIIAIASFLGLVFASLIWYLTKKKQSVAVPVFK